MTEIIVLILGICLMLYILLGGADFGGGILELLTRGKASAIVSRAIAPVWEANHVWLILVIVILFVGFPTVYTTVLTALHLPVLMALIGIILRGTAFTFRHYDIEEARSNAVYTHIFHYSSLITSFFLGVSFGGIILGNISLSPELGFYHNYIRPWFNIFSASLGVFMVVLFAFLANMYTLGETKNNMQYRIFALMAKRLLIALVFTGSLVFLAAEFNGLSLFSEFYQSPFSVSSVVLATLALPVLWHYIDRQKRNLVRIIAAFQTIMIVIGWFAIQYPVLVRVENGAHISIQNASAPYATQFHLLIALIAGVLIIFPSMAFLYKTFKFNEADK